jgi:hypothetical protein
MSAHIEEYAELYALGALDEAERARIDAHALQCDPCARALASGESTVAALIEEREPSRMLDRRLMRAFATRPQWHVWAVVAAAAFAIGLIPSLWLARPPVPAHSQAIVAMTGSHFAHAQFGALTPSAPKAKVIYARTGAWWYVIVLSNRAYTVAAQEGSRTVRLGAVQTSGNAGELFIEHPPAARTLLLLEGSAPVARVTLPYRR